LPHRFGTAGDLVRRLALRTQRDEEPGDLSLGRLPAHDLVHRRTRLLAGEVVAVEQARERSLDHRRPSMKLRASAEPSGVSTDSGWNWTPTIGSVACRTAISSPAAGEAVGVRSSGRGGGGRGW